MLCYSHVWIPAFVLSLLFTGINRTNAQQTTDLLVREISVPGGTVPPGQPVTVTFTIENSGANQARNFFCAIRIFEQSAPSDPIFQNQVNVSQLDAGEALTLEATTPWLPPAPGEYIVQVGVPYEFDNTPSNNVLARDFRVGAAGLLTLAQAIDILNTEVLNDHPRADSLAAIHLSPPPNPSDSLIPPGLEIRSADSSTVLRYDFPVYLFYIDLYPDMLYAHPVEYVTVSAITGEVDRRTDQELWPEIEGITPDFGPYCFGEENPRRVRGNPQPCVAKENPYQPVPTSNTGAWAIAVVGKLNLDIEKSTVQNDICKWKERINGNTLGPQVSGPNIAASAGRENCGLTEKELCDAIDGLKGKGCDKVHFKYIGHGTRSGIIVWDERHRNSTTLSWTKLAKKLKEAGFAEVCLEITACHSGAAIAALKREGVKGTVVTSSSAGKTTPVGDGSGTHWEKALEECAKAPEADLNRNGKIDICELFAWVQVRGGTDANGPSPQIEKLNDSVKFVSARTDRVGSGQTISTNGGPIRVYGERICMKLKVRVGTRQRDSTIYRGSVYIENDGNTNRSASRDYKITARCDGKDVVIVERIRPSLKPGEKQCIADLPNGCTGIKVERLRNGTLGKGDDPTVLSAAADDYFSTTDETAVHSPGQFIFHRYVYRWDNPADPHTVLATGPLGWEAAAGPQDFFTPTDSTEDVFLGALIPDTATTGGVLAAAIVNAAARDTLQVRYNVLLADTLGTVDANGTLEASGRWYDTDSPSLLKGFRVALNNVYINVTDTLKVEGVGGWNWNNVTVSADSGISFAAAIGYGAGSIRWQDVMLRGMTEEGVLALAGNLVLRNVTVGAATGDGFSFSGSVPPNDTVVRLRPDTLEFLNVLGAAGDGVIFDNINANGPTIDTVTVRWLRTEFVEGGDIAVLRNSHVRCVDCIYRENTVRVDGTSSLGRYASFSIAAADTAGDGLEGISVEIVDSLGQTIYSGITDTNGFLPTVEVLVSRHREGNYESYRPFVIKAGNGSITVTDTVRSDTYTQRLLVLARQSVSAPAAGEGTGGAAIVRTIPQPLPTGSQLIVETEGLGTRTVTATLYNTLGETVWSRTGLPLSNDRLVLRDPDLKTGSGLYVLQIRLADGRILSTRVIHR